MKAISLLHVPFERPAGFIPLLREMGYSLDEFPVFSGRALPDPGPYDLLLIMGGPMSVHDTSIFPWLTEEKSFIDRWISSGKKSVGICLGAQLIAEVLGGRVCKNREKEIGWFPVTLTGDGKKSPITSPLPEIFTAFHWHGETFSIPPGAFHLAYSDACENQAFLMNDTVLGLQFHLESTIESIRSLIHHCQEDMTDGLFIQSADSIYAAASEILVTTKTTLSTLMSSFLKPKITPGKP